MLFPAGQIFEIICLFFALRFLNGSKGTYWSQFRWFMLLTVVVEVAGYIMLVTNTPNHWMYNLYLPVEILFKFYILYRICNSYFKIETLSLAFLLVFFGIYFYEGFKSSFSSYAYVSNSIASVGILICCCLYFYYFLKKEEFVNIYTHPPFWIITGLFFFYLGGTACNVFFKILSEIWLQRQIPIRYIIFSLLNLIFYGCWAYAFVCKYRKTISSS